MSVILTYTLTYIGTLRSFSYVTSLEVTSSVTSSEVTSSVTSSEVTSSVTSWLSSHPSLCSRRATHFSLWNGEERSMRAVKNVLWGSYKVVKKVLILTVTKWWRKFYEVVTQKAAITSFCVIVVTEQESLRGGTRLCKSEWNPKKL